MDLTLRSGEFAKYHALGNDYLVIDGAVSPWPQPSAVRAWCDRHTGIGSDGLLVRLAPKQGGVASLRIFNPDGSEAEKSGNGLRIFARFLYDASYTRHTSFTIELGDDNVPVRLDLVQPRDKDSMAPADISMVRVAMGVPKLTFADVGAPGGAGNSTQVTLPMEQQSYDVALVSMGNPHCVVFDAPLDKTVLRAIGPAIEHHPMFARRTNVQLCRVVARDHIELLIWERGAGETAASGSSSCAAVAAAQARGLCDDNVTVACPGGSLGVRKDDAGVLWLEGPATPISRMALWHQEPGGPPAR